MPKQKKLSMYLYGLFMVTLIWGLLSLIFQSNLVPSPLTVFKSIHELFRDEILLHVVASLKRIFLGVTISLSICIPLGICLGYFPWWDKYFSPILYILAPIPKSVFLPIILITMGLGDQSKIFLIFLITFFSLTINIKDRVKSIPTEVFYPLQSIGASHLNIITEVILPGILPTILTTTRISIGTSIAVLFFAENYGTQYGLGLFIMDAWSIINYTKMYAGIVIMSLLGLMFFILIDYLEVLLCPWQPHKD